MQFIYRSPVFSGLAVLFIALSAHIEAPEQQTVTSTPTAAAKLALKGLDAVALINGKEEAGDPAITVERAGYLYRFSSDQNRKEFENDPARFEIQMKGDCAAMPGVEGKPELFAIVNGRIYIFGSTECRVRFAAEPEKYLQPRKNVAIFVHEAVELLDFAGPAEVFAAADHARAFNVYTVAASQDDVVSQRFLTIKPQYTLEDCPQPDIIVLPGGNTHIPLDDPRVIEWIKKSAPDAEVVMSVCTGAFLLAKAGLLDGKEATTHWSAIDALRTAAPKTKVHENKRFVDNGKMVTCAGVSAGIDGALHVVKRVRGDEVARETARYMEYVWDPASDKQTAEQGAPSATPAK
jgi:putative intracellular protease/amidase/YHS domain-containing protein